MRLRLVDTALFTGLLLALILTLGFSTPALATPASDVRFEIDASESRVVGLNEQAFGTPRGPLGGSISLRLDEDANTVSVIAFEFDFPSADFEALFALRADRVGLLLNTPVTIDSSGAFVIFEVFDHHSFQGTLQSDGSLDFSGVLPIDFDSTFGILTGLIFMGRATPVPEPGSALLLMGGLAALGSMRRLPIQSACA